MPTRCMMKVTVLSCEKQSWNISTQTDSRELTKIQTAHMEKLIENIKYLIIKSTCLSIVQSAAVLIDIAKMTQPLRKHLGFVITCLCDCSLPSPNILLCRLKTQVLLDTLCTASQEILGIELSASTEKSVRRIKVT